MTTTIRVTIPCEPGSKECGACNFATNDRDGRPWCAAFDEYQRGDEHGHAVRSATCLAAEAGVTEAERAAVWEAIRRWSDAWDDTLAPVNDAEIDAARAAVNAAIDACGKGAR